MLRKPSFCLFLKSPVHWVQRLKQSEMQSYDILFFSMVKKKQIRLLSTPVSERKKKVKVSLIFTDLVAVEFF